MKKPCIIAAMLGVILAGNPALGIELTLDDSDLSVIEFDGNDGLLLHKEFLIPLGLEPGYCSIELALDITGVCDERLGKFWISCIPWDNRAADPRECQCETSSYWVTSGVPFVLDLTPCIIAENGVASLSCLLGDFHSEATVETIWASFSSKNSNSRLEQLSFSPLERFMHSAEGNAFSLPGGSPGPGSIKVDGSADVAQRDVVRLIAAPNPFNPSIKISFVNPVVQRPLRSVEIYDMRGRRVYTYPVGNESEQSFTWVGTDQRGNPVSSGVYSICVRAGDGSLIGHTRVTLVK